jgi:hypothetical protein
MQRYIDQLIEDLKAAHKVIEPKSKSWEDDEDDDEMQDFFADVDNYVSGDHDQVIAVALALIPEQFPPFEMLTTAQMLQVSDALADLLASWNISVDMPEKLPIEKAYPLMVSVLEKKTYFSEYGNTVMELCNYDSASCPFGIEYCRCKDEEDEDV